MKLSIVITTCNRLTLLKRAIASALAQTVPCEVVVVDDASSDETANYVHSLGKSIIFCANERNLGHSAAMNLGIETAQGDWIKCLDDDDYLDPYCLERLMQAIALYPPAVICSCQAMQVNLEGQVVGITPRLGRGRVLYIPQADIHYGMLIEQTPFGTTSQVAFRREACLKAGGWNPDLNTNTCDDTEAWLRIADYGDALFINQGLVYRTVWQGNYSQKVTITYKRDLNFAIKQQIYNHVHEQHRSYLPSISNIYHYLNLHWGLVALKLGQWREGLSLLFPAFFHVRAWYILFSALLVRSEILSSAKISKVTLIDQLSPTKESDS
jgi:glycosyltransferase involved in cell wall biosynthesis